MHKNTVSYYRPSVYCLLITVTILVARLAVLKSPAFTNDIMLCQILIFGIVSVLSRTFPAEKLVLADLNLMIGGNSPMADFLCPEVRAPGCWH